MRPSWSTAAATWTSLWLSTPTVTRHWGCGMVAMSSLSSSCDGRGGTHRPDRGQHCDGALRQALSGHGSGWWHREAPRDPVDRSTARQLASGSEGQTSPRTPPGTSSLSQASLEHAHPRSGGGHVGGGAQPFALPGGVSAPAGARGFGSVQDRVGGQAGGEGDAGGQAAPGRSALAGRRHHVDGAPGQGLARRSTIARACSVLDAPVLGMCRRNSAGRQTWRARNGTAATTPTITKQLPRPMPSRPLAEPSCWYFAPCTFPARPAACHIPVTVRGPLADSAPVTSDDIVANQGAVKHGRRTSTTISRDGGTVSGIRASPIGRHAAHTRRVLNSRQGHPMAKSAGPRPDQPTKDAVTERILAHARKHWPDTEVLVRHRGVFCYVAVIQRPRTRRWRLFWPAVEEPEPFTVLRLRYQGSADRWLIAIYKASTETFSERELPTRFGPTTGTPEEGMDHTLGFWVGPPATDQ